MDCKEINLLLQEADTTRFSRNRISKRQETFFGHVKRREKIQNLVTTGMIVTKTASKDVGWTIKVGRVTEALNVMRDRDVWKVMIGNAKEHGT